MADGIASIAKSASGATPWGAIIQGGLGLGQMIGGAIGAAKGRRELKGLLAQSPQYKADEGIMGLYNQALQRAGVSPTESALYKRQRQAIDRILSGGVRSLQQQRGGVLGGTSTLARQMADASLAAESAAEQQQAQRFGALQSAAQMAAGEKRREFDINVMQPWQIRAQMAGQRAAGGAQTFNIGAGNIFGAGSSLAQADLYKQIYGGGKNRPTLDEDIELGMGSVNTMNPNQSTINRLLAARRRP